MFDKIKKELDGKDILVLGMGREGRSTLSFIKKHICYKSLAVSDQNKIENIDSDITCYFGAGYMDNLNDYDIIIKTPGIKYDSQSDEIKNKTLSQTDLFLLEFSSQTVGITGTKGKSTTTTLIHHILSKCGFHSVLTGNIGIPPLDSVEMMTENSVAVFEMSCHQLQYATLSPHIAVLLNLFEDHLDHYGTRENYIKAKENIFLNQKNNDFLVISEDCTSQIKRAQSKVIKVGFDSSSDVYLKDNKINGEISLSGKSSLIGLHNLFNISVSFAVSKLFGISVENFLKAIETYKPLPHRLEFVCNKNGVDYYDDSISTVGETTIQAIKAVKNVGTVIIGGMDRGIEYNDLVEFLKNNFTGNIILIQESGKRISEYLLKVGVRFTYIENFDDAIKFASEITKKGQACVFSPAAASYGYFKNFEERGDRFKELVNLI